MTFSDSTDNGWVPFDEGRSIGREGSEDGLVMRDEAYGSRARLTLENETFPAPYAITCGIYGWMMHTRYFASLDEAQAAFSDMKPDIERILTLITTETLDDDTRFVLVAGELKEFIARYP